MVEETNAYKEWKKCYITLIDAAPRIPSWLLFAHKPEVILSKIVALNDALPRVIT